MAYPAAHAIDRDLDTMSKTGGGTWLQIKLDHVHCVKHVVSYSSNGRCNLTWTCSQKNCSRCEGQYCGRLNLTVSGGGQAPKYLPPDCKYGDTVKLEAIDDLEDGWIPVREIAVTAEQG